MLRLLLPGVLVAIFAVQGETPITVSAATSLTDVLEEIVAAYGAAGAVRLNFAGSNVLARQIVHGAPADLFISADDAQMDLAEHAGAIVPGSRVALVRNQLAIVAAAERAALVRERFFQAPPEIRRLAMGDPAAVPAGVYGRQYLESRGVWQAYAPRVVPSANVRAALVAVETGSADAAIVYASELTAARTATLVLLVPLDQGPRIVYPAALVQSGRNRAAASRFLAFLRGPQAAAIFTRHKFVPAQ